VNTHQDRNPQPVEVRELIKQSSRKGRKLIAVEISETMSKHEDRDSQPLKIGELIKQSSRNGRKLIDVEIA